MSSKRTVRYACPYCQKRMEREDLVVHIGEVHDDLLPEGFTPLRYVFNYVNRKPETYHGVCTECKGPTEWDENKGRYNRQCNNPKCKESFLKNFEKNMVNKLGVSRISATAAGQEKMLANRKISGKYKFQNGVEKTYTGSYELKALQFMDEVMRISPDDIMCPGPVLEYIYEGKKHIYITDFYYIPYNLVIEVKDGGNRPNTREMPEYRAKQVAKERYIIENTEYNYLRLVNNDLSQLLGVFADLKMQLVENTGERVIHVNEAMDALMSGYIPGMKDTGSVFIVNYLKNNVFSGESECGYGISDNIQLTNLICRNKEGILEKAPENFLQNAQYNVYGTNISVEEASKKIAPYMRQFVEEGFLYETLFGKKFYTYDQVATESSVYPVMDYYKSLKIFSEISDNMIRGCKLDNKYKLLCSEAALIGVDTGVAESKSLTTYVSLEDGSFTVVSNQYPELFVECKDKDELVEKRRILEGLLLEVK